MSISEMTSANRGMARGVRMLMRVLGAVLGSYALTALMVAATSAGMSRLGMLRSDAAALAAMLGFVIYLALLLWAFSVQSVMRLWLTLATAATALAILLHVVR